jgi:hypothetical protein
MRIAVVGDVHGHLELMYAILGRWQRESGERLDLILQCGDMGSYSSVDEADRATLKHAQRDPEELGFAAFAGPTPPSTALDPRPPLVFIPGNHEDFAYLEECERRAADERGAAHEGDQPDGASPRISPISEDGLIGALRSGETWTFAAHGRALRVAGVSGAAGRARKQGRHPRLHLDEEGALRLAAAGRDAFDVLISHDGPSDVWEGAVRPGSEALRLLIEECQPRLAFFGHHDRVGEWTIGRTRVLALAGCGYQPYGSWRLKQGGIALLHWDGQRAIVERLDREWLRAATLASWRHWERAR